MIDPQTVRFLNLQGSVKTAEDWNSPAHEKLWLYNLHYFDDLNAIGAAGRREWHRALIDRWITENPPMDGNGWEPYPVSLRIVNWIKFALACDPLPERWLTSLALQARWLEKRVEWHLLGNHLFTNAKALIFAGLFFEGAEADRWRRTGLRIIQRQLPEQVLSDGGHFELSPMYHAIFLEDLLDLMNIGRAFPLPDLSEFVPRWQETVTRMRHWLNLMSHPDGNISFFNDAAMGVAPTGAEIEDYGARLGFSPLPPPVVPWMHLSHSGYFRWDDEYATALLDIAPIGPDYLPGHAHADTLSFELSLMGERIIVNSGTSTYADGPQRQHERGTAAHSTVEVDGRNSSDVWASFRVGHRARVLAVDITAEGNGMRVSASHDGYKRLGGAAVHHREWQFGDSRIIVRDRVVGRFGVAIARFHLSPNVEITMWEPQSTNGPATGTLRAGHRVVNWRSTGETSLLNSEWHPEFGCSIRTFCIAMRVPHTGAEITFDWSDAYPVSN